MGAGGGPRGSASQLGSHLGLQGPPPSLLSPYLKALTLDLPHALLASRPQPQCTDPPSPLPHESRYRRGLGQDTTCDPPQVHRPWL